MDNVAELICRSLNHFFWQWHFGPHRLFEICAVWFRSHYIHRSYGTALLTFVCSNWLLLVLMLLLLSFVIVIVGSEPNTGGNVELNFYYDSSFSEFWISGSSILKHERGRRRKWERQIQLTDTRKIKIFNICVGSTAAFYRTDKKKATGNAFC